MITTQNIRGKMNSSQIIGAVLSIAVITLLILSGPAAALNLKLNGLEDEYSNSEDINFLAEIDVEGDEIVNMVNITLYVDGNAMCTFDVVGNEVDDCTGVHVDLVSKNSAFGYGYGHQQFNSEGNGNYEGYGYSYGYGETSGTNTYNITIHAGTLDSGDHTINFKVNSPQRDFTSEEKDITITGENQTDGDVNLFIKEWYPKGDDFVFVCDASFNATHYSWYYGDGHKLINITNSDTYHIYEEDGNYDVRCIATNGEQTGSDQIEVNVADEEDEGNLSLSIKEHYPKVNALGDFEYVFECNALDFNPSLYNWWYGDGEKLIGISNSNTFHTYTNAGNYTVVCSADDDPEDLENAAFLNISTDNLH